MEGTRRADPNRDTLPGLLVSGCLVGAIVEMHGSADWPVTASYAGRFNAPPSNGTKD